MDRRFDILALRGVRPLGVATTKQSLFDETSSGELVVGIHKLAQRWALEFLTERGSMRFKESRGCQFMQELREGRLRTESDVDAAFQFSSIDIRRNLINEEAADMPDDERYAGVELKEIVILEDRLHLTVQINSLAGDAREIILPTRY